ncbi:MAG: TonB-dependent receptor domain-containing protein [Sandaracinobacter sp.]
MGSAPAWVRATTSVAAIVTLLFSTSALAQQAPKAGQPDAAANAGETSDIIVIAPIREAQALAIQEQRNADNLVAIVAADSIGRFPDQNSAAALARLPAVAVQRDQGQERYIQVRGAPNRWTSVSFDGVPVIGVDEGGTTRAFRFDAIPSVILSSIAVNKSLTPDLPAEAIVAQSDMRTYTPFEATGFALAGDLGYGWMGFGGGQQRQGSLRASWSNDSWGFVVSGSHYLRDQITDNREFAYDAANTVSTFDFRNYLLTRQNNGASAGVEFRPSDGQSLFLKAIWSEFRDDEERNQYVFTLTGAQAGGTRTNDSGSLIAVPVRGTKSDSDYRNSNLILTGGGGHEFGNDWKADWRLNYTRIENSTNIPLVRQNQSFQRDDRPSLTYARATWEVGPGQIVFGARGENFRQTSVGVVQIGTKFTPLEVTNDYWDIFPSVNARFDLSDDIVARASFQRGVARPSFGQVRVGAAISDTSTPGTVTGGNPNLRPEYTWGTDASLEWYLPGDGLLSVSGFYRWVDDVLYDSRTIVGDDRFDIDGIDRSGYDFISTLNGDRGRLYGVEFAYLQQWTFLPGALDGFGFQGNIAFIGGSFDTRDRQGADFPGTSDTVVNASLFYEKFGLSARLSYQWRSDWVDTLGGLGVGSSGDERRAAYSNLDLAIRYQINRNVGLFFDANNLTDEIYVAFQGERERPTEVEQIGRRFMGGVRFDF